MNSLRELNLEGIPPPQASMLREMLETSHVDDALTVLVTRAADVLRADFGYVLQRDEDGETSVVAYTGRPSMAILTLFAATGPFGQAWESETPQRIANTDRPGVFANTTYGGLISALVPQHGSRVLLVLARSRLRPVFQDSDVQALAGVAELAALALSNVRRVQQLQRDLITQERLVQDAKAAVRARSAFFARMSHDLRTPLSSVLGFAQLLEMGDLEHDQQEYVGHILQSARQLLGQINDTLDLSLADSGKLTLTMQPVNAVSAVTDAAGLMLPEAREKKIKLEISQEPDDLLIVQADPQRLRQVLLNLISNAIIHNRKNGTVTIDITALSLAKVSISVTDTGPGVPTSRLPRLFRAPSQLDRDSSNDVAGQGLPLTQALVEAMGGLITVMSTPDEGSTFTVELPRVVGSR